MKNLLFKLAFLYVQKRVVKSRQILNPLTLQLAGWWCKSPRDGRLRYEFPDIKKRDKIIIEFEISGENSVSKFYRVFVGENETFFALESYVEWLVVFLMSKDKHREFKESIDFLRLF